MNRFMLTTILRSNTVVNSFAIIKHYFCNLYKNWTDNSTRYCKWVSSNLKLSYQLFCKPFKKKLMAAFDYLLYHCLNLIETFFRELIRIIIGSENRCLHYAFSWYSLVILRFISPKVYQPLILPVYLSVQHVSS